MLSEPASDVRVVGSPGDGERMGGTARAVRRVGYGIARGLVAALSLALLLTAGYGWSVYRTVNEGLITSEAIDASAPPPAPDQPFTALLVGLDSRTDAAGNPLPPELLTRLRAGDDEGQLHTDTIILLHAPTGQDANAVAISIPRDSFVEIAGTRGMHKINSAYGRAMVDAEDDLAAQRLSGPELDRRAREAGRRTLVATVEQLTGAPIDHYAEINLAGFVDITEAVGGVPVCLKRPEREVRSGIDLPAGLQTVRGADALAFVRQRRGLEDGDLDRIARQQAFLAGLANRLLSTGTLTDPRAVRRLVEAVSRHVVLDRGWNLERLITQFRRMTGSDIRFVTIPTGTAALRTRSDGIAVEVDPDEVARFVGTTIRATDAAAAGSAAVVPPATRTGPTRSRVTATPSAQPAPAVRTPAPGAISAAGVPCVD
jgi:LCP family protein required for cell wall assembly